MGERRSHPEAELSGRNTQESGKSKTETTEAISRAPPSPGLPGAVGRAEAASQRGRDSTREGGQPLGKKALGGVTTQPGRFLPVSAECGGAAREALPKE